MQDLRRLLKKKNPSGRDLGRIDAANDAIALEAKKQGKVSLPIMDFKKFNDDINALSEEEWDIFNQYGRISDFLNLYYAIAEAMEQQTERAYAVLDSILSQSALSEDIFAYVSKLPAIMTKKQYEDESQRGLYLWTHDEEGNKRMWSFIDIFFYALTHFTRKIEEYPRRKNPLQPIKKKYMGEPVQSDIVLSRYNKAANRGYYELPDGRRSDKMSPSRWKKATTTAKMRKLEADDITENIDDWKSLSDLIAGLNGQRIRRIWEGTDEIQTNIEKEALIEAGFLARQTFKLYEEPPENLSKWDVAKDPLLFSEIYPAAFGGLYSMEDYKAELADFASEFSELVEAISEEIDSEGFFDFSVSGTPAEEWGKPLLSLQDIYNMNFYGIAGSTNSNLDILFPDNARAKQNGVAVLQDTTILSFFYQDSRGYYKAPYINHSVGNTYSLEDMLEGSPKYEEVSDLILRSKEELIDGHYFLRNWNTLVEMIDEIYEIPHIDVYMVNTEEVEEHIEMLNLVTMDLYNLVYQTNYGEAGEIQRHIKLEAIKKLFGEIDISNSDAPNENINQIYALLTDSRLFVAPEIIEGLMLRRNKGVDDDRH